MFSMQLMGVLMIFNYIKIHGTWLTRVWKDLGENMTILRLLEKCINASGLEIYIGTF